MQLRLEQVEQVEQGVGTPLLGVRHPELTGHSLRVNMLDCDGVMGARVTFDEMDRMVGGDPGSL